IDEVNTWTDQSMLEHRPEVDGPLGQCWNIALRLMDAWGNSRCGAIDALEMEERRGERTEVNTWTDQSVLEHRPEVDGRLGDGGEERGRKSTPGPTSQCWNIALRLMDAWGNSRCGAIDALEMEGRREDGSQHLDRPVSVGTSP
ncbi:hypothetical protein RRG08_002894, partial [Elysia crispata]